MQMFLKIEVLISSLLWYMWTYEIRKSSVMIQNC